MKFTLLFLFLVFGQTVKSQTFYKSSIDSLVKEAKNKKEKKIIINSFDSRIKENLIGNWKTSNSNLHFQENNYVRIEYKDSATFDRKYFVKDGIITIVEEKEPSAEVDFRILYFFYVKSISADTIEWNYPDKQIYSLAIRQSY